MATASKRWYKSWTVWGNIGMGALTLLAGPQVNALLPPKAQLLVTVVANLALRAKTTGAITVTADQDPVPVVEQEQEED